MVKWRKLLIFPAALVMVAALVILLIPSPEPRYQGRSLTAWLLQAGQLKTNSADFELARRAVTNIGTNAVPFLLADALYRLGPEANPAVPALLNTLNDEGATVRQWATNALHQIAPEAPTYAK